jgi:hypothetical protein
LRHSINCDVLGCDKLGWNKTLLQVQEVGLVTPARPSTCDKTSDSLSLSSPSKIHNVYNHSPTHRKNETNAALQYSNTRKSPTHHSTNQSIQKPLKPSLPRRRNIQTPTLPPTRPNRTITLKPIQQPRLSILRLVGIAASQTSRSICPCMHRTAADIDVRRVSIAISSPFRDRRSRGRERLADKEGFSVDTGV